MGGWLCILGFALGGINLNTTILIIHNMVLTINSICGVHKIKLQCEWYIYTGLQLLKTNDEVEEDDHDAFRDNLANIYHL